MIDVLLKTKSSKLDGEFSPRNLKAGILYNEDGKAINKVFFYEQDGYAKEVWNDKCYSLEKEDTFYVTDIVNMQSLFIDTFGAGPLKLSQLYIGYKMYLNDSNYLSRHLEDFGMTVVDVGYKCKKEIVPDPYFRNSERQELFTALMKIINYKDLNIKINEEVKIYEK